MTEIAGSGKLPPLIPQSLASGLDEWPSRGNRDSCLSWASQRQSFAEPRGSLMS